MCLKVEAETFLILTVKLQKKTPDQELSIQCCESLVSCLKCTSCFCNGISVWGFFDIGTRRGYFVHERRKTENYSVWPKGNQAKTLPPLPPCHGFEWDSACQLPNAGNLNHELSYCRRCLDSEWGLQDLFWVSGKGLPWTGQKYSAWGLGPHRIRQRASKPVPWWSEGSCPEHFCRFEDHPIDSNPLCLVVTF